MPKKPINNTQQPDRSKLGTSMYDAGERNEMERNVPMRSVNMKTPTRAVGLSPSEKGTDSSKSSGGKSWLDRQRTRHARG